MTMPACLNCGTPLAGRWCHACGQKRLLESDRSVKNLLGEFVGELTQLDGRFLRSFSWLVFRPGRLAGNYLAGIRRRYLSPITLFLVANVLYFFAPTLTDFSPSLWEHVNVQPYAGLAKALLEARLELRDISFETYAAEFGRRQGDLAKTLLVVHVPLLALGLWPLHFRRRYLLADHMLVAFYIMAFVLLHGMLMPLLLLLPVTLAGLNPDLLNWLLRIGLLVPLLVWFFFLLRGAYRQTWWEAALKTALLFVAFALAHFVYRLTLFVAVFAIT